MESVVWPQTQTPSYRPLCSRSTASGSESTKSAAQWEIEPLVSARSRLGGTKTSRRSLVLTSGHLSSQVGGAIHVTGILDRASDSSNVRPASGCEKSAEFSGHL